VHLVLERNNMLYILAVALTLVIFSSIIIIIKKINIRNNSYVIHRQSDVHKMLKYFFSLNIETQNKPASQLTKRLEKDMIRVIVVGSQAYWVSDNTFYVADALDGEVDTETAKPVDVQSMSKLEVSKMLSILDSLTNGKVGNDRSSSGNE
jgi:hypothetical protein